jgi:hypothetical protein
MLPISCVTSTSEWSGGIKANLSLPQVSNVVLVSTLKSSKVVCAKHNNHGFSVPANGLGCKVSNVDEPNIGLQRQQLRVPHLQHKYRLL